MRGCGLCSSRLKGLTLRLFNSFRFLLKAKWIVPDVFVRSVLYVFPSVIGFL